MASVPEMSFKKKIFLYLCRHRSISQTDHSQVCLKKAPYSELVTEIAIKFSAH